jgi:DMSO reductase anchor subunit
MRPTFSIIVFTVLSGAGYGLLFLLGLGIAFGAVPSTWLLPLEFSRFATEGPLIADARFALAAALAVGVVLATIGLFASTAHLGKPLRAWRAFSQWRSSWLSREGVASLLTYAPVLALMTLLVAQAGQAGALPIAWRLCGAALCLCCAATVYCTAHIYSSLKPIRAWHQRHVPIGYQYLSLYSGALWVTALATLGIPAQDKVVAIWVANALVLAPCSAMLKRGYWRSIDALSNWPNAGTATGLDRIGSVRSFEQPHTEENYLTHEMGFVLARKHSRKLRAIAFWLILLTPLATLPLAWLIGWPAAWLGLLVGMTGIFVERWLFFAEAKHAVMAYYGR